MRYFNQMLKESNDSIHKNLKSEEMAIFYGDDIEDSLGMIKDAMNRLSDNCITIDLVNKPNSALMNLASMIMANSPLIKSLDGLIINLDSNVTDLTLDVIMNIRSEKEYYIAITTTSSNRNDIARLKGKLNLNAFEV